MITDKEIKNSNDENKKILGIIPLTSNVKTLLVMMSLSLFITIAQYFGSVAANSNSLKIDCISMGIDALSYFGNIIGECSDDLHLRARLQLFFSLFSILLLFGLNTWFFVKVINNLWPSSDLQRNEMTKEEGVVAWLVIFFASVCVTIDIINLSVFIYYNKADSRKKQKDNNKVQVEEISSRNVEKSNMNNISTENQKDSRKEQTEDNKISSNYRKPKINMLSALLHTGTDLLRAFAILIGGIYFLSNPKLTKAEMEHIDNVSAFIICITVYLGNAWAVYEWIAEFQEWNTNQNK